MLIAVNPRIYRRHPTISPCKRVKKLLTPEDCRKNVDGKRCVARSIERGRPKREERTLKIGRTADRPTESRREKKTRGMKRKDEVLTFTLSEIVALARGGEVEGSYLLAKSKRSPWDRRGNGQQGRLEG